VAKHYVEADRLHLEHVVTFDIAHYRLKVLTSLFKDSIKCGMMRSW